MEQTEHLLGSNQLERVSIVTSPTAGPDDQSKTHIMVPLSMLLRALSGIAKATKSTDEEMQSATDTIKLVASRLELTAPDSNRTTGEYNDPAFSLLEWHARVAATTSDDGARHRANLALALAFLCHSGRHSINVHANDLDLAWYLVREALLSTSITFTVTRSAQGFLAIPLWSTVKDGNIGELFRFHVWLPDPRRGDPNLSIHAHQSFAESWILAGQGRNHSFDVQPADKHHATHAEYSLVWSDSSGKTSGKVYQTHQKFSSIMNTGRLVQAKHEQGELHSRNMSYTVPAGACHASEVVPNLLHATLFLFDSSRGFEKDAPVLGPIEGQLSTHHRDPAGVTPITLVDLVESVRAWEILYQQGLQHGRNAQWEEASQAYRGALHVCNSSPNFPDTLHYKQAVLDELGTVDKMLGRCEPTYKVASNSTANPTTAVV